jgi:putative ABC transport system permease protein
VAVSGASRRWVQTGVIFVIVGVAAACGVLGLTMATSSDLSFQTALAKRRAPDLAIMVNAAKGTAADLARTRHLKGVTQAVGPYPATTIAIAPASGSASRNALTPQPLRIVARASRQGPLDRLSCFRYITGVGPCGWPSRTGQIALAASAPVQLASNGGRLGPYGTRVLVRSLRAKPRLTVVGYAVSILEDADGWAVPAEIAALQKAGAPVQAQMLYTFSQASTNAQINSDLAELKSALPAGAIISSRSLPNQSYFNQSFAALKPPFVEAYALIVLLLASLITAIVVAAAVMASYRRIGMLKSIGFTPAQIVGSYLGQLALPALAGAVLGTVLGSDWVVPLINGGPYHVRVGAPLWIKLAVPIGVCALVALAGLIPALRAAKLTALEVMSAGETPHVAGGSRVARVVGRLPLPRPVALGLASAFARPGASVATAAVITLGLVGAVMAVGLSSQMLQLAVGATSAQNGGVVSSEALVRRFTVLVAVVAGLGVLSAVVMLARQRAHDLGVCKAIGMTPRQVMTMITSWVLAPGIAAVIIALPVGIVVEHAVAKAIVSGQISPLSQVVHPAAAGGGSPPRAQVHEVRPPPNVFRPGPHGSRRVVNLSPRGGGPRPFATQLGLPQSYNPGTLALVVLAGLAIATVGALVPASWAATARTTSALRAE